MTHVRSVVRGQANRKPAELRVGRRQGVQHGPRLDAGHLQMRRRHGEGVLHRLPKVVGVGLLAGVANPDDELHAQAQLVVAAKDGAVLDPADPLRCAPPAHPVPTAAVVDGFEAALERRVREKRSRGNGAGTVLVGQEPAGNNDFEGIHCPSRWEGRSARFGAGAQGR